MVDKGSSVEKVSVKERIACKAGTKRKIDEISISSNKRTLIHQIETSAEPSSEHFSHTINEKESDDAGSWKPLEWFSSHIKKRNSEGSWLTLLWNNPIVSPFIDSAPNTNTMPTPQNKYDTSFCAISAGNSQDEFGSQEKNATGTSHCKSKRKTVKKCKRLKRPAVVIDKKGRCFVEAENVYRADKSCQAATNVETISIVLENQPKEAFVELVEESTKSQICSQIERNISLQMASEPQLGINAAACFDEDRFDVGSELDGFTPYFQRISVSEGNTSGYSTDELSNASRDLLEAIEIRQKYMEYSHQSFPLSIRNRLQKTGRVNISKTDKKTPDLKPQDKVSIRDHPVHAPKSKNDPWECKFMENANYIISIEKGIYKVYKYKDEDETAELAFPQFPEIQEFVKDLSRVYSLIANGPLKSYCYRRLSFLSSKFQMHLQLNEQREVAEQKKVAHRDFYNVRKVDTHIHASSCMNHKTLLRFIKKTLKTEGDTVVCLDSDSKPMTLNQVFQSMKLKAYDLNVDILDVHVGQHTFHRFDKFNAKFSPIGENRLRHVFLKTDNYIQGRYFGELIKGVMQDLEDQKYQNSELRISIYGRSADEWDKLASWAVNNNVYSDNVRWLIQVPRIFDQYKKNNVVSSFQDFLQNLFKPLFEVTNDPSSHPELHKFLQYVIGFDSVDDESKPEIRLFDEDIPTPNLWTQSENPPYTYYIYYMYRNLVELNHFRHERGLSTFVLRPHCGEAGPVQHLAAGFMMAEGISHGVLLRKVPVLQYLYYLCQIGIAMSPLSNNSLFLNYNRSPLPDLFARGLMVSLSTDDPLQFHYTREPLMEEYSNLVHAFKLSSSDMCELARNSVLSSGFCESVKKHWLGPNYTQEGVLGNDAKRTNVPDIRIQYRSETMNEELSNIFDNI